MCSHHSLQGDNLQLKGPPKNFEFLLTSVVLVNDEIYAALTPQIIIFCRFKKKNYALLSMCSKKQHKIYTKEKKQFLCLVIMPFILNQMIAGQISHGLIGYQHLYH